MPQDNKRRMKEMVIDTLFEYNRLTVRTFPHLFELKENKYENMNAFKLNVKPMTTPNMFYGFRNYDDQDYEPQFMEEIDKQSKGAPVYLFLPDFNASNSLSRLTKFTKFYQRLPITFCEINYGMMADLDQMENCEYWLKIRDKLESEIGATIDSDRFIMGNGPDFVIKSMETVEEAKGAADVYMEAFGDGNITPEISHAYQNYPIKTKDYEWIVVKKDDKVVACGQLIKGQECACLQSITTRPSYQGHGFATMVVVLLMISAKKLGYKYCALHSTKMGKPIYEKLGFQNLFDIEIVEVSHQAKSWIGLLNQFLGTNDNDLQRNFPLNFYGRYIMATAALVSIPILSILGVMRSVYKR